MNIAYYPGCSLHSLAREYDYSARLVCRSLDIVLHEIEDWSCCGASAAHSLNQNLAIDLAARNLQLVREMGMDKVTTPCAACFNRLKTAAFELNRSGAANGGLEKKAGIPIPGPVKVEHLLQLITRTVDIQDIVRKVTKPLKGLRVAAYYGCLLTRPARIAEFDDPEQPVAMDVLLQVLGAETVKWAYKAECCGGGYTASETDIVLDLGGQVLDSARQAGAEVIAVACPMCQSNLDTRQQAIATRRGQNYNLPIIYFTQLMALAFGLPVHELGFKRHLVNPLPLLVAKGLT